MYGVGAAAAYSLQTSIKDKGPSKLNREVTTDDLVRNQDAIRLAYLTIRDALYAPPRLANTHGDPLVFHTLKFRIESAERAFEALMPLAFGQLKEEILEGAKFDEDGKLRCVEFDWRKKANAKIPSWDNTVLGNIKIAARSLIAEVNSENRAKLLQAEIEKRLGASATHQWERRADDGMYQAGLRPDFYAIRRLLNLTSPAF